MNAKFVVRLSFVMAIAAFAITILSSKDAGDISHVVGLAMGTMFWCAGVVAQAMLDCIKNNHHQ
jgi:hypothetical protein